MLSAPTQWVEGYLELEKRDKYHTENGHTSHGAGPTRNLDAPPMACAIPSKDCCSALHRGLFLSVGFVGRLFTA